MAKQEPNKPRGGGPGEEETPRAGPGTALILGGSPSAEARRVHSAGTGSEHPSTGPEEPQPGTGRGNFYQVYIFVFLTA